MVHKCVLGWGSGSCSQQLSGAQDHGHAGYKWGLKQTLCTH